MVEYKLSASLQGHEDDVRAVAFANRDAVVSASRDATVRYWNLKSPKPPTYDPSIAFTGQSFINALTFIPPTKAFPDGLIVSGGKDTLIDIRPPGRPPDADAERLLLGHQGNVCTLDVDPEFEKTRMLVSGSWDTSALIWDLEKGEPITTLGEHGGSVWTVLIYDRQTVITGCADKLIRVWSTTGKLLRTIEGSTDVVRALCRLTSGGPAQFASAGNDAVIRLWTIEGHEVAQLHGHENFIYSISCLPNGDIVSSSEDRTVRIWRHTECIQTITHPAISVWSVAVCSENGDIVTGASDKIVRIFSKDPERHADEDTLKAFTSSVQASAIPQQQMPGINKDQLPGPDFLKKKSGIKDGQVQMIRDGAGNVTAHMWSAATREWTIVGTVVDAQGSSGRKTEYMGQDYDYVFDVDAAEGQPALKLPYNLSQNPYEAAQKFVGDNELPISYVDQVANFILTNTQGATIGQTSSSDPPQQGSDPWGSENRYRPDQAPAPSQPRPKAIPQNDYLYITTANYAQMFKKIMEINENLSRNSATRKVAFSSEDLQVSPKLATELESALSSAQPKISTSETIKAGVDLAAHIITNWPPVDRIPGLDLFRLLTAASPDICGARDYFGILYASGALPTSSSGSSVANANTTMLALRSIANLFAHPRGRDLLSEHFDNVWSLISPFLQPPSVKSESPLPDTIRSNRNVHIAAVTIAINYAVMFTRASTSSPPVPLATPASAILTTLTNFINDDKIVDGEVIYRGLVAMGTLMAAPELGVVHGSNVAEVKRNVRLALNKAEKGAKEPRIKGVVGECRVLLD